MNVSHDYVECRRHDILVAPHVSVGLGRVGSCHVVLGRVVLCWVVLGRVGSWQLAVSGWPLAVLKGRPDRGNEPIAQGNALGSRRMLGETPCKGKSLILH